MRPHRLRMTGFGPFADTVEVDLDALAHSGLFLLHGETGAGKTTLLDGIGFALFGAVPGARKQMPLRSHHVASGVGTEVALEVTLAGRRLRVTRSPAYTRAKARGTGTTTTPAKVLLEELTDAGWVTLSTRIDETAEELDPLLGMSAAQFFQVVLLPQGEFARFLRADSEKRGEVLEKLFGTVRFGAVEDWLADRRATLAGEVAAARHDVRLKADRVARAAQQEVPETGLDAWSAAVLLAATSSADACASEVSALQVQRDQASAAWQAQRDLADRQARRAEAERRSRSLDEAEPEARALTAELDRAQRALGVAGVLEQQSRRAGELAAAQEQHARARALLGGDLADPVELQARRTQAQRELGAAGQLLEVQRERDEARTAAAEAAGAVERAQVAAETVRTELFALPAERSTLEERLDESVTAERRLPLAQQRAELAARAVDDLARLAAVRGTAELLAVRRQDLRDAEQALQQRALDLRERRIDGMVAELASHLEDGVDCPVCGSQQHPDPSLMPPDHVSRADEESAEVAHRAAVQSRTSVEAELAVARAEVERLAALVGDATRAEMDAELETAEQELAELTAQSRHRPRHERALVALQLQAQQGELALAAAQADGTRAEQDLTRLAELGERKHQALVAALGADPGPLDVALADLQAEVDACEEVLRAVSELERASAEASLAAAELAATCLRAGFEGAPEVQLSHRSERWVTATSQQLAQHAAARAGVAALLASPDLQVPLEPTADLDPAPLAAAEEALGLARQVLGRRRAVAEGLADFVPALLAALADLAPLEERASEVRRLADLCAGQGANELKMTLSAFVLAARLEEVAEVASARLQKMTQGRYQLVHSDDAAKGGKRSGLGLKARDAWTGQDRDTSTLSGGETFLASLALALALAEVVTQDAGGGRLDALFVDEGFGTLDEQTLDEVMDVLDGLREGGRLVGVVSHVAELKQRIPAQVHVCKTRTGSTVEVLTG